MNMEFRALRSYWNVLGYGVALLWGNLEML